MSAKLDYLQAKKLNPADDLRETLTLLEEQQAQLKTLSAEEALALLHGLDRVGALLIELEAQAVNLLSERTRFETVQGQLKKRADVWLKTLGGAAKLAGQRPQPAPNRDERWWWFIDELEAARTKRGRLQLALGLTALVLVLAGLILLFKTVLAPSPEVLARLEAEDGAMRALDASDVPGALAAVQRGLAAVPNEPRLLVMQGIFQELLAQPQAAAASFAQAQTAFNDLEMFHLFRTQIYIMTNQLALAEAEARTAVEVAPNSAQGWLLLGQVLEQQQRRMEAAEAYNQAAELATANGDSEIVVMSRLALARLSGAAP